MSFQKVPHNCEPGFFFGGGVVNVKYPSIYPFVFIPISPNIYQLLTRFHTKRKSKCISTGSGVKVPGCTCCFGASLSFPSPFFYFIASLWARTAKNTDCSTGSLACPFARSLAFSGLLALLAPSTVLTCSLARSLRSLPRSWESEL